MKRARDHFVGLFCVYLWRRGGRRESFSMLRSRFGYRQMQEIPKQKKQRGWCFCGLQYFTTTTNKFFVLKVESSGGNIQSLNLFRALYVVIFFFFFLFLCWYKRIFLLLRSIIFSSFLLTQPASRELPNPGSTWLWSWNHSLPMPPPLPIPRSRSPQRHNVRFETA